MKSHQAERHQKLLAQAEVVITELLSWEAEHAAADLDEMETELQRLRHKLSEQWLNEMVRERAQVRGGGDVICEHCGQVLRAKGHKGKRWQTLVGELEVERSYYYCPVCQSGIFPPGPATETTAGELE